MLLKIKGIANTDRRYTNAIQDLAEKTVSEHVDLSRDAGTALANQQIQN